MNWVKCLPLALLYIRTQPRTDTGISTFEMMYEMPYDFGNPTEDPKVENTLLREYIIELIKGRQEFRKKGLVVQRPPLNISIDKIQPGDQVLIKTSRESPLTPRWEGSFVVLLTTDTAIRTAERGWTHASRVKGPVESTPTKWLIASEPGDLRIRMEKTGTSE